MKKRKNIKYLAIIIVLTILLSTLASAAGSMMQKRTKDIAEISQEDKNIASQISNTTGVNSDEIIVLKRQGKTWNEILEILKSHNEKRSKEEKAKRKKLLAEASVEADIIKKLREDGHSDEELTQANMNIERVIFQLKEIASSVEEMPTMNYIKAEEIEENQEDISSYTKLLSQINPNTAIYLMLKLKSDLGSMKNVLDEYLYALQIEINLEKYIEDKEAYKEEKIEKSLGINPDEIITLDKIEEKILEKLQRENEAMKNVQRIQSNIDKSDEDLKNIDSIPQPPLPELDYMGPKDPLEDIMKEINEIKDRSLDSINN